MLCDILIQYKLQDMCNFSKYETRTLYANWKNCNIFYIYNLYAKIQVGNICCEGKIKLGRTKYGRIKGKLKAYQLPVVAVL